MPPEASGATFDFEAHRIKAVEEYRGLHSLYAEFAEVMRQILESALTSCGIKVASIEARAKDLESFGRKAAEPSPFDPNQPKYKNPITEITDMAGVRAIAFFPKTVDQIDLAINNEFEVREKSDKRDLLEQEDRLGYQSIHYLVTLKQNRTLLTEYRRFTGLIAELQVRTILQHAWAEIEHDIQYKSVETIPTSIRRRFISLAGLFEIADREFQTIQDEDDQLRKSARLSVQEGKLEAVEITADALKAYLDGKLGSDGRMTEFSYEWEARMLRRMGFTNFHEIAECIRDYDDDRLSRVLWGTRQGQLTRFEILLLAGMGEGFIIGHNFRDYEWFVKRSRAHIGKLADSGVKIGNYQPSQTQSRSPKVDDPAQNPL